MDNTDSLTTWVDEHAVHAVLVRKVPSSATRGDHELRLYLVHEGLRTYHVLVSARRMPWVDYSRTMVFQSNEHATLGDELFEITTYSLDLAIRKYLESRVEARRGVMI